MKPQSIWSKACACVAITALIQPTYGVAQQEVSRSGVSTVQLPSESEALQEKNMVVIGPRSSEEVARRTLSPEAEPNMTTEEKIALLRKKVKYVFVLFQENRSFDFYFGTFPGARGLFSQAASRTAGFNQPIVLTDGSVGTITPFKIPQTVTNTSGASVLLYPEDTDSVNHAHAAIDVKLNLNLYHVPQNDRYAFVEEGLTGTLSTDGKTYTGAMPTEKQVQKGELVMGHVDCDTAPFLWTYADHFTLFDNFFDTVIGPSTPNAIAMIAGQSGETQWVKHPELASNVNTTRQPASRHRGPAALLGFGA